LLEREPDRWRVLKLPALAEDGDALGREPGEPLWPEWEGGDALADKRRTLGERDWSALFQQDPRPLEGSLFKIGQIGTLDAAPVGTKIVRAWDLASTAQTGTADPDWTVGVKMVRTADDRFVVLDVARMRGGPEEVIATIRNTAAADGRAVRIQLPQDPGQAGKAQVLDLTKRLVGFNVASERPTGDKATRAAPFAAQVNVGNVSFVRGVWNDAMREEMRGFPSSKHDDQIDAASDAFAVLVAAPGPARLQKIQGF
jgi:predicted phage terminase large subunit-like protein